MNTKELASAIDIAHIAESILNGGTAMAISPSKVTAAIRHRFGYEGKKHSPHLLLREALSNSIGLNGLTRLGIGHSTISRLAGGILGPGAVRNPIQNIAALQAVFGGFREIEMAFKEISEQVNLRPIKFSVQSTRKANRKRERFLKDDVFKKKVEALSTSEKAALKDRFTNWATELKTTRPDIRLAEVWKCKGVKSARRYFRCFETEWFENLFRCHEKNSRNSRNTDDKKIEAILSHIKKRYELAIRDQPQKRITKTYLFANVAQSASNPRFFKHEKIQTRIAQYVDTPESRLNRCIELICIDIRRLCSEQNLGDLNSYSNKSIEGTKKRLQKARAWLSKNT